MFKFKKPLVFCLISGSQFPMVFFQAQTAHLPFLPTSPSRAAKGYEPSPALRTTWPSPCGRKHENSSPDVAGKDMREPRFEEQFLWDNVQLQCSTMITIFDAKMAFLKKVQGGLKPPLLKTWRHGTSPGTPYASPTIHPASKKRVIDGVNGVN